MPKVLKEPVVRVTIKLPKSVAESFRKIFSHGRRSQFVVDCILDHIHKTKVGKIEEDLRAAGKHRQQV